MCEKDDGRLAVKVHDNRGAGITGVADGTGPAEQIAAQAGRLAAVVPAQGASDPFVVVGRYGGHRLHSHRAEDALPVHGAAVHDGRADDRQVFAVREHAGVARVAAVGQAGQRIVHFTPERLAVLLHFGRGHERHPFRMALLRHIARMLETKCTEYVLLGIVAKFLAGDVLQDVLHRHEIETAVHVTGLRTEIALDLVGDVPDQRVGTVYAEALQIRSRGDVGCQTGGMRHHILYGDVDLLAGRRIDPGLEVGNVHVHIVGEAHITVLHQLHERERGTHALAHGSQVEDGLRRHRNGVRHDLLVAVSLQEDDLVIADYAHDAPRDVSLLDGPGHLAVNLVELRGIHPHRFRGHMLQSAGRRPARSRTRRHKRDHGKKTQYFFHR